ncbi:glycosyltransferase [Vagococcus intermedius]|uniref:Glycosyltransferase n=1 Tax=Vagococcus intermedius TaxID=2991418 RepID=A0AAF0CVV7_9ENTE|nr:glycosyltransferase [Vagococcus intermedius]WEG73797.1 glycosyltransferase [Vagococcus intermedius]WEG75882.1 glycosyltransferase [Vagococcus intermedius]
MKILIVNTVCGVGSTGRICTDLYDRLTKNKNISCCIAYGRGSADEKYNTYKIGGKTNVISHVLETRLLDNHGLSSRKATKNFIEFIRSYNPDVIHLHNLHGYYLNVKILFSFLKESGIKIIWTLHDTWGFSGHSATLGIKSNGFIEYDTEFKYEGKEYPETYCFDRRQRNLKMKQSIFINVPNLVIVTPSKWLERGVKNSFLSIYNTQVIYNGINKNLLKPPLNRKDNERIRVLGVANIWVPSKGLNYFNELADFDNNRTYEFVVVGDILDQKINKNIKHIKKVESLKILSELYGSADVFFNPTTKDNFPTTNIEALSCGTPVLTFDTGGSPEAIDSNTGMIINNYSIKNISDKIIECANLDRSECVKRSNKFRREEMVEQYSELYNS